MENNTIPTQTDSSVNQNIPIQPIPIVQPKEHSQKSSLIILVAISFLVIGGFIGYMIGIQNSKPVTNQMQTVQPTKQADNLQPTQIIQENEPTTTPTNSASVVPDNYVKKETLCYTYAHPPEFEITQDNSCYQVLRDTDQSHVFFIKIDSVYEASPVKNLDSLDSLIVNRVAPYTIIESSDMLINHIPAKQIIEKDESSPIKLHQIRTFVYLPNKYDRMGREIVGFEIQTNYNETEEAPEVIRMKKETLKALFSSIVWK